jgi:glycosyltransferase involved in cell wall biosynthesis
MINPIMKLTIIIPIFNEVKTINEIIQRVEATGLADEILVIDDGSTDGSRDVLAKLDGKGKVRVIYHEHNQGKGKAVRTGIQNASNELILIQDADCLASASTRGNR